MKCFIAPRERKKENTITVLNSVCPFSKTIRLGSELADIKKKRAALELSLKNRKAENSKLQQSGRWWWVQIETLLSNCGCGEFTHLVTQPTVWLCDNTHGSSPSGTVVGPARSESGLAGSATGEAGRRPGQGGGEHFEPPANPAEPHRPGWRSGQQAEGTRGERTDNCVTASSSADSSQSHCLKSISLVSCHERVVLICFY